MMGSPKILAQVLPVAANTDTLLYNCQNTAVLSTVFVCNLGVSCVFRLWVRRRGETTSSKQYLYYDEPLTTLPETMAITAGITLSAGDDLMCRASTTSTSFNVFGVEG